MKKIALIILLVVIVSALFAGCGSSAYAPKELAAYGNVYKADKPAFDGSNSVINIASAKLNSEGSIVINVGAPLAQEVAYAYKNFIAFDVIDASGNSLTIDKIAMSEGDHQDAEVIFTLKGSKFSDAKYIKITPYKTSSENPVVFELQK